MKIGKASKVWNHIDESLTINQGSKFAGVQLNRQRHRIIHHRASPTNQHHAIEYDQLIRLIHLVHLILTSHTYISYHDTVDESTKVPWGNIGNTPTPG